MNIRRPAEKQSIARLFFALWPSPALREGMHAAAVEAQHLLGGRVMRKETLHMTLLFLGDVVQQDIPGLMRQVDEVDFPAFSFHLSQRKCWRHNRIVYLAPDERVAALDELVRVIGEAADAAGIVYDRRAFTPHVTLIRKVEQPGEDRKVVLPPWDVKAFSLVESRLRESGAEYRNLGTWHGR